MGRLNEVDDDLWHVALNAIENVLDEALDDAEADLHEDDHHGQLVVSMIRRNLHDRIEGCRRDE